MPMEYRIQSILSIPHVHGHLCKHLGIDLSTNPDVYFFQRPGSNMSLTSTGTASFAGITETAPNTSL